MSVCVSRDTGTVAREHARGRFVTWSGARFFLRSADSEYAEEVNEKR